MLLGEDIPCNRCMGDRSLCFFRSSRLARPIRDISRCIHRPRPKLVAAAIISLWATFIPKIARTGASGGIAPASGAVLRAMPSHLQRIWKQGVSHAFVSN